MPKPLTNEDRLLRQNTFIEKAKSIHGDRFDYSKVYYINNHTKVCIMYGKKELWQTPTNHLQFKGTQGTDAMERSFQKKMTKENWEKHQKAVKRRHNLRYRKKVRDLQPEETKRKFLKVRKYTCILCGKVFERKECYFGYKGLYCSQGCVQSHNFLKLHKTRLEERLSQKFVIITTEFRKKKEAIASFTNKKDALKKFQELENDNRKVMLPQRYVIKGKSCVKTNYEILLIERSEDERVAFKDRDELGKLVDIKVEAKHHVDKFIVINKIPYYTEQMFNIRGYDTEVDINYIINMLLSDEELKNIMVYNNDLIIKKENDIKMILSKHQNIIFDLYNYLQSYCKRKKIKYISFMGMIDNSPMLVNYYDNLIKEKYGI